MKIYLSIKMIFPTGAPVRVQYYGRATISDIGGKIQLYFGKMDKT